MTPFLTVLVGGIAAVIAGMQWFVARQRFVLDLFDRRFRAYNDVLLAMRPFLESGSASDHNKLFELQLSIQNAKFLFGSDVNDYLQEIWKTVVQLRYWGNLYATNSPEAEKAPQAILDCNLEIERFFTEYPKLCESYMMMPEKRVRTPVEWFHDRNDLRKSYGDEPKKPL